MATALSTSVRESLIHGGAPALVEELYAKAVP